MPVNNASNFLLYGFNGFPEFKNLVPKTIAKSSASLGNIDLYTVPVGKKVFVCQLIIWSRGSFVTMNASIKSGGVYYTYGAVTSNSTQFLFNNCPILLAGETIAYNVTSAATYNTRLSFFEFDDDTPLTRGVNFSLGLSNTIYTCPANTQAYPLNFYRNMGQGIGENSSIYYENNSGAVRTINLYYVPSGSSALLTNRINTGIIPNGNSFIGVSNYGFIPCLNAGDSYVFTTDTAGNQIAWVNVVERKL